MASGISKAKARRNTKSKRRPGFQGHPAKAGRRKVYGPIVKDKEGNIVSGQRKVKPLVPPLKVNADGKTLPPFTMNKDSLTNYQVFNPRWKTGEPVMVTRKGGQ